MNILLESDLNEVQLNRGDILFRSTDTADSLYLLKQGKVICVAVYNDRLVPLFSHEHTGIIGEESVLSLKEHYGFYAVALEDSTIVNKISAEDVQSVIESASGWVGKLLTNIADKVSHTAGLISEHQIIDERLNNNCDLCDDDLALVRKSLD